jgi:hypothetical protein
VTTGAPLRYEALRYDDDAHVSGRGGGGGVPVGASTSFELLAASLPAVLDPSPFVTADHQTANARHLAARGRGGGPDAELTAPA